MRVTSGARDDNVGNANAAAAAVFTDNMLFQHITALQSGYPQAVAELMHDASEAERRDALRNVSSHYNSRDKRLVGVLPRLAIAKGDPQTLRLLFDLSTRPQYQNDPWLQFVDVMQSAVAFKRVDVLECLAELKLRDPTWQWEHSLMARAVACSGDDLRALKWLYHNLPRDLRAIQQYNIDAYAHRGGIELVRWLHEHGYTLMSATVDRAALLGRLDVVEYLYQHTDARCSPNGIQRAALNGFVNVVKIVAVGQTEEACASALDAAAYNGHLEVVQYLVEHGIGVSSRIAVDKAAQGGHQSTASYLLEHLPGACTSRAMESSVARGRLDILTLLHKHQAAGWTPSLMDVAAARGFMDIVKFLHEHRTEGCTAAAMDNAASNGYLSVVKFLHEHRAEGCTTKAMNEAAKHNHLDIVKFLHENRTEGFTAQAMIDAAARDHLEVVKFLHEHRSKVSEAKALQRAVMQRRSEIADYLCTRLSESDIITTMALAVTSANVDMLRFLHKHASGQAAAYAALMTATPKQRSKVVKFLCENQVHHAHGSSSFLMRAVEDGIESLVDAVLPYASLAEVTETKASTMALGREVEPRILLALENRLRELSDM